MPANHRKRAVVGDLRELHMVFMHQSPPSPSVATRLPDDIEGILADACALIARIILLAPRERQRVICDHVQHEIGDIVDHILTDDSM